MTKTAPAGAVFLNACRSGAVGLLIRTELASLNV
jgi:hypothetical protein